MADKSVSISNKKAMIYILQNMDSSNQITPVINAFAKIINSQKKEKKNTDTNNGKIFNIKRINYSIIAKIENPVGIKDQIMYTATIISYAEGNCPFPIGETFQISKAALKLTGRPTSSLDI